MKMCPCGHPVPAGRRKYCSHDCCAKAGTLNWRARNHERYRENMRKWQRKNKHRHKRYAEYYKRYYIIHRERLAKQSAEYYQKNKERMNKACREIWASLTPEERAARRAKYKENQRRKKMETDLALLSLIASTPEESRPTKRGKQRRKTCEVDSPE